MLENVPFTEIKIFTPKPKYMMPNLEEKTFSPFSEKSDISEETSYGIINESLGYVMKKNKKQSQYLSEIFETEDDNQSDCPRLKGAYLIESSPKIKRFKSLHKENEPLRKSLGTYFRPPTRCENPIVNDEYFNSS